MGNVLALKTDIRPGNEEGWPRTQRQHSLCYCRVVEGMSTEEAALKAGYSANMARKRVPTLLKGLSPYCEHLQKFKNQVIEKKLELTAERVAQELAAIAFVNVLDYLKPVEVAGIRRFVGKAPDELTEAQARAVTRWRVEPIRSGDEVIYNYRYEFYDKKGALTVLGRHLGMFDPRLIFEARTAKAPKVDLSKVPDEVLEKWMKELQSYQHTDVTDGQLA